MLDPRLIPRGNLKADHHAGQHDDEFDDDGEPVLGPQRLGDGGEDHGEVSGAGTGEGWPNSSASEVRSWSTSFFSTRRKRAAERFR